MFDLGANQYIICACMLVSRTGVMYTAITGQNHQLKELLARNADDDLQTSIPGPYMDFNVPEKYTLPTLEFQDGKDAFEIGFT